MDNLEKLEQFEREDQEFKEKKSSKKKKEDDAIISTSFLETEDFIYEQINTTYNNNKNNTFAGHAGHAVSVPTGGICKYDKVSGSIEILNNFMYQNKLYQPIVDDLVSGGIVLLPNTPVEYGTDDALIKDCVIGSR